MGHGTPSVFPRGGSLLPSASADVRATLMTSSHSEGLHLFDTPSKHLPGGDGDGDGDSNGAASGGGAAGGAALPVFKVAVLEAGGRPLLSPPNVPHMVITLETCTCLPALFLHAREHCAVPSRALLAAACLPARSKVLIERRT